MRAPDFWYADKPGLAAIALSPLGGVWTAVSRARAMMKKPAVVDVPVLCVGNAVTGGAGKTPVTLSIAFEAGRRGLVPHILTRGYGGRIRGPRKVDAGTDDAQDVGDEALLLGRVATTWICRDRAEGAHAAVAAGAEIIIMDDGFQNPSLKKDVCLLVVDGETGFGNGLVMPAGPLREPLSDALDRAQAAVILGADNHGLKERLRPHMPVLTAKVVPAKTARPVDGKRVLAFAGIGRPEKFFATVKEMGAEVVETRAFSDHHRYRDREIEAILADAREQDAIVMTTEKDWVRLPGEHRAGIERLPVEVAWDDPHWFRRLTNAILEHED